MGIGRCRTEQPGKNLPLSCCTGARRQARSPRLEVVVGTR